MPIITVEGGKLSREKKRELIHQLTETASKVTGIPKKFYTVAIRELEDENLGLGGSTVEEIKAKKAGES